MTNTEVIYSNSSTAQNDVKYLTGFDAPDPVVFINTPAEKLLLVPVMEKGRAINDTYKNVNVLSYSDINMSSNIRLSISNYILDI